ncbi:hypothetical protein [Vibrio splendidus]|uniref:hypothetical protein n=1 Tax=Vibrio splendidus TaxID=29497 RepID=UPI000C814B83|nr:hypothetical protein [Vibrio splendidus]PMG50481.1 hypothetical protein BCU89_05685 [Vibrio splendidus]
MIKELLTSWFNENKVKITSPVVGSFIGAWVLFNWKSFLLLFWGAGTLEERLKTFDTDIVISNFNIWLCPLLVALAYAFGLPYLNILTQKVRGHADRLRYKEVIKVDIKKAQLKAGLNEEIYKSDPTNLYLGRKIEAELKKMEAEAERARSNADEATANSKEAIAQQEKTEAEAKQEKLKATEALRKDEHVQQAHELSKSRYHQEIVNNNFPTLYLFLDILSKSLLDDNVHLSIGLMSEAIASSFGYDDVESMLIDDKFTLQQLEKLAYVVYEDKVYLKSLKDIISRHNELIDEGDLFDHLVGTFEKVDRFRFIPSDSIDDVVKDYLDDTGHFHELVNDEHVNGATSETNSHSFGVEYVEFSTVQRTSNGEYVADAIANIQGEVAEDTSYCGHEIEAKIQLAYKPIIGRNGYANPEVEVQSASLRMDY